MEGKKMKMRHIQLSWLDGKETEYSPVYFTNAPDTIIKDTIAFIRVIDDYSVTMFRNIITTLGYAMETIDIQFYKDF